MADMPTDFWSGWIVLLTVVSFAALGWLLYGVYFADDGDTPAEHTVWDGNLREGAAPAPMWWFWLIFALMVFSVFYLMFYPGLGSFKGALEWSQGGRLDERQHAFEAQFSELRGEIAAMPLAELREDEDLMGSAAEIYEQNCAVCHGLQAQGQANLFPNLNDGVWQWGGDPASIEQTLRNGRLGLMVGWGEVLGQEGVNNVADYVLVLGTPEAEGHPGQAQFNQVCIACHTAAGTGNVLLGAPDLTDDVWLYGSDLETIRTTIRGGRAGQMPAFGEQLDDTQIRLLVAWLTRQ